MTVLMNRLLRVVANLSPGELLALMVVGVLIALVLLAIVVDWVIGRVEDRDDSSADVSREVDVRCRAELEEARRGR